MGPPKGRARSQADREKSYFKIQVKLIPTDEVFNLNQVHNDMKISELKAYLEFATGLPTHVQRVSYLDEGELLDDTDVRSNDIVTSATLHMRVWPMWTTLVEAVAQNEIDHVLQSVKEEKRGHGSIIIKVMTLGVTNPTEYRSPNSDYMTKRARKAWLEERASVALIMAANRGMDKMCTRLIESGADVNAATRHGRSALHIASAQGHGHIVDLLLEKGADIDAEDDYGETALSIAERFGFKSCGRHLFLFHWQQRAKKVTPARNIPLMPHQKNDSLYPVWKKGQRESLKPHEIQAQLYLAQQGHPEEYEGTGLGAPKRSMHPGIRKKLERDRLYFCNQDTSSRHESEEGDYFPDGTDPAKIELPAIDSPKSLHGKKALKKPSSYDEWLQKIKDAEEKVNEEKRKIREEQKLKRLEEEEKRKEENERLGYERWLVQRQQEKADRLSRTVTATSRSRRDYTDRDDMTEDGAGEPHPVGALRSYLRSLGQTKAGIPYEKWLSDKEKEVQAIPVGKSGLVRV